jgi:urease accessory protein
MDDLNLLRLIQLADSALPIGSTAHSCGLETLVDDGVLTVAKLADFLRNQICETGSLEAAYCLAAHALAETDSFVTDWLRLNMRLDAIKTARESRAASAALGRRLLQLVRELTDSPLLEEALKAAKLQGAGVHYCAAFGLAGGVLGVERRVAALAYLNQAAAGMVSACQRLLPLGQTAANQLQWQLKAVMIEAVNRAEALDDVTQAVAFNAMIDLASARHPALTTRLFIS